jgi:ribosomal protein S18 acetylase RimI-like enzyme
MTTTGKSSSRTLPQVRGSGCDIRSLARRDVRTNVVSLMNAHVRRILMSRPLTPADRVRRHGGSVPELSDVGPYAELMLHAYRGTIDDEGETMDDARAVMIRLFVGEFGLFHVAASSVVIDAEHVVAATFVTIHEGIPLVAFSMTAPGSAGLGHARRGLHQAYGVLSREGHDEITLVVTDGNSRAQGLYVSEGFATVAMRG